MSFTYPGTDRPVLRDISFEIGVGQAVAIVGENGSGKTTLTKLLCGLYATTSGAILWDDEEAADVDPEHWRSRFGVVFQDFMRYELSARLNVAIGRHEAQDDVDEVRAAARLAEADSFLGRLPGGYETVLSRGYAGGADLSLGQWQRVALARAFFSDAPVLVLDEPTAALDPRVEQELLARVRSFAGTRQWCWSPTACRASVSPIGSSSCGRERSSSTAATTSSSGSEATTPSFLTCRRRRTGYREMRQFAGGRDVGVVEA